MIKRELIGSKPQRATLKEKRREKKNDSTASGSEDPQQLPRRLSSLFNTNVIPSYKFHEISTRLSLRRGRKEGGIGRRRRWRKRRRAVFDCNYIRIGLKRSGCDGWLILKQIIAVEGRSGWSRLRCR